jgi:uncharacterized HAD superfamily protein
MKVIGIDLDDVLLNFNDAFLDFHNSTYSTSNKREDITSFYLEEIWGISKEEIYINDSISFIIQTTIRMLLQLREQ